MTAPYSTGAPEALYWDGVARDYGLKSGRFRSMHYVDAKVWKLLRTPLGSIKSAPGIGCGILNIVYINAATVDAEVGDCVRQALADPLSKKEIQLGVIQVDTSRNGTLFVIVNYTNLVTAKAGAVPVG